MSKKEQVYQAIFDKIKEGKMYLVDVKFKDTKEQMKFCAAASEYFKKMDAKRGIQEREIEKFCYSRFDDSKPDKFCGENDKEDNECPLYDSFLKLRTEKESRSVDDFFEDGNRVCGLIALSELNDDELESVYDWMNAQRLEYQKSDSKTVKKLDILKLIKMLTVARNSYSSENYKEAVERYTAILEINPSNEEAKYYLYKIGTEQNKN